MTKILTIFDKHYNGKTGKKIYQDYQSKYGSCILRFKENKHIFYKDIKLIKNNLYINDNILILKDINIIIFNYGEDCALSQNYLKKVIPIYEFIKKFVHISIFNNPLNHSIIADKLITYQKLKSCDYVKIPDFGDITDKNDIKKINNFPIIISRRKQSGGLGKYKINSFKDFEIYDTHFFKQKYWAKFYYSYLPNTKIFICIRLFIFNNKLIDFVCRPSIDWNVHTGNQIFENKKIIIEADNYFKNYIQNNKIYIQNILDELYNILGNGLYTHDFIIENDKLILCELGYKTLDPKLIKVHTDNNLLNDLSYKISNNPDKVHNIYKELLINYK